MTAPSRTLARNLGLAAGLILGGAAACRREAPPKPAAAPRTTELAAWSWRPLGGFMVIEGELDAPARLVLEGPNMRLETNAPAGPVRWELARPAAGERADLKIAGGPVLARWTFGRNAPGRREATPAPVLARKAPAALPLPTPVAQASAPAPEPPPPVARAVAPPSVSLPGTRPTPILSPASRTKAAPAPPLPPLHAEARPLPEPVTARIPPAAAPAPRPLPPATLVPERTPVRAAASAVPFPGAGEALNLVHGPRKGRTLVLTFDGGSGAESAQEILDALKARHVRTTFFLTAPFIEKFPAIVRRMAAEGHELGNHSTTHPHMAPGMRRDPKWTKDRVQAELLDADAALLRLLGRPMDPYWRAPYGEQTQEIRRWAEEIGYRHVGWSEGGDSLDWATPAERKLYRSGERILDKLHARMQKADGGGLIVLMHLGSGRDEEDRPSRGLGAFMDRALRDGWRFASVGDSLRELGKPAWDSTARLAWIEGTGAVRGGGQR